MLVCCIFVHFRINKEIAHFSQFHFVLVDDQAWNGTSVEMVPGMAESASDFHETPHLESLAAKGMRFSNARACAPVCAPSRYSIQFGKSPARMRMIRVGMDASHIPHDEWWSIARVAQHRQQLRRRTFWRWEWVQIRNPWFDQSDGPTKNTDGGFVNNATNGKPPPEKTLKKSDRLPSVPKHFWILVQRKAAFLFEVPTTPFTAA